MAGRASSNDHDRLDLVLESSYARIADLRTTARTARAAGMPSGSAPGPLDRLRDVIGGRLIALGNAVATDDALRRRPALRP